MRFWAIQSRRTESTSSQTTHSYIRASRLPDIQCWGNPSAPNQSVHIRLNATLYALLFTHLLFSSFSPGIYETRRHLSLIPPLSPASYLVGRRLIPNLPTQQGNCVRVHQPQNKSGALPTKDRSGLRLPLSYASCLLFLPLLPSLACT